ncbi:MAG: phosphonopyruvate decarboxylase [Eubacterium sp.]|nr:phosphonopyruvate decarboxylase [Eubacterium sp.]
MGISTVTGIPDSALKPFCDYMNGDGGKIFCHYVPANEGAAVGIAVGSFLASGKPACIYAQNSGLGNMVNPITSLMNREVYGIPALFLIGWRGEPGTKDEPQHKFMGMITEKMLGVLQIRYSVLKAGMPEDEIEDRFAKAKAAVDAGFQYAFVIAGGFFDMEERKVYQNGYALSREMAVREMVLSAGDADIFVSTTGKISRELYEQSDRIKGYHRQAFLTVGGMGHASMAAFGIAKERPDRRVYCLDGDGAVLMHMGSLAFLGRQGPDNLVHVCLDNCAHESVGGMPVGSAGLDYAEAAAACGYPAAYSVETISELKKLLAAIQERHVLTFLNIKVSIGSRPDLGRPKETAVENKDSFMRHLGGRK